MVVFSSADDARSKPARDLRAAVDQHVAELNAEQRSVRDAAKRALKKLGPAILPHLPPAELLPNEQVRSVIRGIRRELERQKAREAANPSRVDLIGTHSLAEALKSISEQSENGIDHSKLDATSLAERHDFKLTNAPFWAAIDDVCKSAKLEIALGESSERKLPSLSPTVRLVSRDPNRAITRVNSQHAIRVQVTDASLRPLFGDAEHQKLRIGIEFQVEPRLRPLFLKYRGGDITAALVAKAGEQVLTSLANLDDSLELPLGEGGRRIAVHADFRVPIAIDANARSVNTRGTLMMQCAAATERIRISNIAASRGVSRRRGGVTLLARQVNVVERDAKLDMSVQCVLTYDVGGPAFESHRTWIFHNQVFLQEPQQPGSTAEFIRPASFEIDGQADGGVMVTYQFRGIPPRFRQATFEYHAPTLIVDIPVEFRFDGIQVDSRTKR
ncbi:MAG: hypothetical protein O3A00_14430 [Planctomycetota bacterium]|nr:hypothetical protein [Planctomycetota bacterium]